MRRRIYWITDCSSTGGGNVSPLGKTIGSKRHKALIALLIKEREAAGMTQTELAKALGQYQSFVARIESGERRVDVIEFLDIAKVLGFDPKAVIAKLQAR